MQIRHPHSCDSSFYALIAQFAACPILCLLFVVGSEDGEYYGSFFSFPPVCKSCVKYSDALCYALAHVVEVRRIASMTHPMTMTASGLPHTRLMVLAAA